VCVCVGGGGGGGEFSTLCCSSLPCHFLEHHPTLNKDFLYPVPYRRSFWTDRGNQVVEKLQSFHPSLSLSPSSQFHPVPADSSQRNTFTFHTSGFSFHIIHPPTPRALQLSLHFPTKKFLDSDPVLIHTTFTSPQIYNDGQTINFRIWQADFLLAPLCSCIKNTYRLNWWKTFCQVFSSHHLQVYLARIQK
jgi:hypothetical protein